MFLPTGPTTMRTTIFLLIFVLSANLEARAQQLASVVLCKKTATGAINFRTRRCASGETQIKNITTLQGPSGADGANGVDGEDGSLRIYGDGSSGPLIVGSSTTWTTQHLGQYTDCQINSAATLTIPSGTILRCSGTFTNNGTIVVDNGYRGAQITGLPLSGGMLPAIRPVGLGGIGWGLTAASQGAYGTDQAAVSGGAAGFGMLGSQARTILRPGPIGGGAGGASVGTFGSEGGGSVTILAAGALLNNGTITADADLAPASGAGGGAGGIIILASRVSVTESGSSVLSAIGSDGGASISSRGAGGGGGGGIIHVLAPEISNNGTRTVTGGAAGSSATPVSSTTRGGGGGGGSCGGAGGAGATVASDNSQSGATGGTSGLTINTTTDPTSLF
jgi:hypothetical protein